MKTMSSKGGGGFNELRFEDKKGEEQVFVHAERNMDIRVKSSRFENIGGARHRGLELAIQTDASKTWSFDSNSFLMAAL